jgi:hypothetical protein
MVSPVDPSRLAAQGEDPLAAPPLALADGGQLPEGKTAVQVTTNLQGPWIKLGSGTWLARARARARAGLLGVARALVTS